MNSIRQERILSYIEQNHIATIRQLQELCPDVSLMTIHRDLDALQAAGNIVKIRGGARSVRHAGDLGYDVRLQENNAGKLQMAQKALKLIHPGSAVFLDAGTTNLLLARSLPDINLHVFTTGPNIAIELCRLHNPQITLCCGTMNRKNMALSGQKTVEMLHEINIDLAFVGVSGCSAEAGFTCGTEGDMVIKRTVIQKARTSMAMCGGDKFSRLMPYTFARFSEVDCMITDTRVPESIRQAAEQGNMEIL